MNRLDNIAIIIFIACDIIIENGYEIKMFYKYKCKSIQNDIEDIFKRLFK